MQKHGTEVTAKWYRFSDYTILEDAWSPKAPPEMADHFRFIRPSPNARLEVYRPTVVPAGDVLPGDKAIDPTVAVDLEALQELDLEDELAILAWCRKFGLLGILPHTTISIRLAPRWLKGPGVDPPDHLLFPTQMQYFRTNMGWKPIEVSNLGGEQACRIELDQEYPYDDWYDRIVEPGDTSLRSGAVVTPLFSDHYEEMELERAIGRYFPSIPPETRAAAKYPMPGSTDFWYQYGESVAQFRHAVRGFKNAVEQLKNIGSLSDAPADALRSLSQGHAQFQSLLSASPDIFVEPDGSFSPQWGFSSLLAMFALSIWQYLIGGKSIRHCKRARCRKIFVTKQHNQDYCSKKCRRTDEKARQRRQIAEARRLYHQGIPIEEIAELLETGLQQISKWVERTVEGQWRIR